jgi:hypothetical protein
MTNVNSKNLVLKYEEMKHFSTENKKMDGRNLQWWRERWICRLDLVEGTSNGGGSVDMQPRFGGRNLQWWRERWICRLDLVEGTSNAASIWWKKPQITTTSTAIGGSKKVVVEEVTIGCYLNPQNSLCTST